MEHVARTEKPARAACSGIRPRLLSRLELLLKAGLLVAALALTLGAVPCGAATSVAAVSEEKTHFDEAVTPATDEAKQRHAGDRDDAPLLILTLVGLALLAISRVPSNPKKKEASVDSRAGKNGARGQDLPVAGVSGTQLALR